MLIIKTISRTHAKQPIQSTILIYKATNVNTSNMKIVQLFFLVVCFVATAGASVIPGPTLDNPCQIDRQGQHEFPPLGELLTSATAACNTAISEFEKVSDKFLQKLRLNTHFVQRESENVLIRRETTTGDLTNTLQEDYVNVSAIIILIQQAINDQTTLDSGRIVPELNDAKKEAFTVLCQMDTILRRQGTPVANVVTSGDVSWCRRKRNVFRRYGCGNQLMLRGVEYMRGLGSFLSRSI